MHPAGVQLWPGMGGGVLPALCGTPAFSCHGAWEGIPPPPPLFFFSGVSLVDRDFQCGWGQSLLPKFLYTAKDKAATELTRVQAGELHIHHRDRDKNWTHEQLGRRNGCPVPLLSPQLLLSAGLCSWHDPKCRCLARALGHLLLQVPPRQGRASRQDPKFRLVTALISPGC